MKGNVITITRKELARFFSNKTSAFVSIALPGLLIFFMWTFMGDAMGSMFAPDMGKTPVVATVNAPESVKAIASDSVVKVEDEASLPSEGEMRERIDRGDVQAYAVFPQDFDEAVAAMEAGEKRTVTIPAREAYGDYREDRIEHSPMYALPNAQDIKVGKLFYFVTEEGLRFPAKVLAIDEGMATVDFNHPLAGKDLTFEIELVGEKA